MKKQRMKDMGIHIARVCCAVPSTFVITDKEREEMESMEVKSWYRGCFPTDELCDKIPDGYTFGELFYLMDRRKYSYKLFADDSIVRERIFAGLAFAMNVSSSEVSEQWMICNADSVENVFEIMNSY